MIKSSKRGCFDIYVNSEYLCRFRCTYGEVLNLIWSLHYDNPMASIDIRFIDYDAFFNDDGE